MTDPLALDNQLCFALYAANRAVTARYRPLLAELELTYPQYLVMLVLWEAERDGVALSVRDIGHRLRLDSGTLTPLLKRLVSAGLVVKARSAEDERVVAISLTAAGRTLRGRAESIPPALLCSTGIAPDQLFDLRDQLRALLCQLEEQAPIALSPT